MIFLQFKEEVLFVEVKLLVFQNPYDISTQRTKSIIVRGTHNFRLAILVCRGKLRQ